MEVVMDAKTARTKVYEKIISENRELIEEYTNFINDSIINSINHGKTYYGKDNNDYCSGYPRNCSKYFIVMDVVESKFKEKGYRFHNKISHYCRWDDEDF